MAAPVFLFKTRHVLAHGWFLEIAEGVAFVTKRVYEALKVKESRISHSFQYRRHFKSCALVTKTENFNIKGGRGACVSSIKIRVGCGSDCGYRGIISA